MKTQAKRSHKAKPQAGPPEYGWRALYQLLLLAPKGSLRFPRTPALRAQIIDVVCYRAFVGHYRLLESEGNPTVRFARALLETTEDKIKDEDGAVRWWLRAKLQRKNRGNTRRGKEAEHDRSNDLH